MTITVTDTEGNSKIREVKDLSVATHEVPTGKGGQDESKKCVEFTVIGANHEWRHYMLYDEFVKANPNVEV